MIVEREGEEREAGDPANLQASLVFGEFLELVAASETEALEALCRTYPAFAEHLRSRWGAFRDLDGFLRNVRESETFPAEQPPADPAGSAGVRSSSAAAAAIPDRLPETTPARSLLPSAACAALVLTGVLAVLGTRDASEARAATRVREAELETAKAVLAHEHSREERLRYAGRAQAFASALEAGALPSFEGWLAATPPEFRGWEWDHMRLRSGVIASPVSALPGGALHGLAIAADGSWGIALGEDERVRRWSTEVGAILATSEPIVGATSLALSRDAALVAVVSATGGLHVLHAPDLAPLWSTVLHPDSPRRGAALQAIAFDPRALFLVAGGEAGTVTVLDIADGRRLAELHPERGSIRAVQYSPDGAHLALTTENGWLVLYEGAGFTRESEIEVTSTKGARALPLGALAFSPDSTRLAIAGSEGVVHMIDAVDARERVRSGTLPACVDTLAFAADGGRLLAGTASGNLYWLDARSAGIDAVTSRASGSFPLAVDPAGALAWTARSDSLELTSSQDPPGKVSLRASGSPASALALSPDGEWLAASQADGKLVLWSVSRAQFDHELEDGGAARALAWQPSGERLLCATGMRVLVVTPASSAWSPEREIAGEHPLALAWVNTSEARVLTEEGGSWRLDPDSGEIALLHRFEERLLAAALEPDGERAILACASGACVLVDPSTGEELERLDGCEGAASLALHPGGERVFLVDSSGALVVVDRENGARLACLRGKSPWTALALTAGGERVATAGLDGSVVLWETRCDPESVRRRARPR